MYHASLKLTNPETEATSTVAAQVALSDKRHIAYRTLYLSGMPMEVKEVRTISGLSRLATKPSGRTNCS
jgi:hypothetical protein